MRPMPMMGGMVGAGGEMARLGSGEDMGMGSMSAAEWAAMPSSGMGSSGGYDETNAMFYQPMWQPAVPSEKTPNALLVSLGPAMEFTTGSGDVHLWERPSLTAAHIRVSTGAATVF